MTTVRTAQQVADVAELLTEAFAAHRDRLAVSTAAGSISYRTLDGNSAALAAVLRARAGQSGASVVVPGTRDLAFVTSVVAVLRAGLRLVTVDPVAAPAHLARVVELAQPQVWIALGDLEPLAGRVVAAEVVHTPGRHTDGLPEISGSDPDTGYLFFTSGTSGAPKAVVGRSRSLARFLAWQRAEFVIGPGDRFGQLTAAGFDVVLRDLLTPLVSGARLCLPPADLRIGDPQVLQWLASARITHLHAVPSVVSSWLAAAPAAGSLRALRHTFFAGESLRGSLVRRWRAVAPHTAVTNLYGPTETTLAAFAHRVPQDVGDTDVLPVGRPRPDVELGFDGTVGAGTTSGEVTLRTRFAGRGYLGASTAESERFGTDPDDPDLITYWTGDAGHLDADGNLFIDGRVDRQVKINGVRTEPDGIAALIASHPHVTQAAVEVVTGLDGRPRLAAYVVGDLDAAALRTWLGERIAATLVPATVLLLSALPLLPNGKVDRRALAGLQHDADAPLQTEAAGDDPLVEAVRAAFGRVLEVAVEPDSDFFALGGDSLAAAELSQAVQDAVGRTVRYSDIFEYRTPFMLAAQLGARATIEPTPIPTAAPREQYPLSPQQLRYLRVYLPRENRSWANMPALWQLPEGTTEAAVQAALDALVERHDSLRAYIVIDAAGERGQAFVPPKSVPLTVTQVPAGPTPTAEAAWIADAVRADAGRVIDVESWPLFRAVLFEASSGVRLLWNPHHLVSDGQSQNLILEDLQTLLAGKRPAPLPVRYRDYTCWRAARAGGAEEQAQLTHWREVFAEPFDRLVLPAGGDVTAGAAGRAFQLRLDAGFGAALAQFARSRNVTPFAVVLAAQLVQCHALYRSADMVIGTPAGGRTHEQIRDVVGNFISLVTMRHQLTEAGSFGELVEIAHRRTSLAMSFQDLQYDRVMDLVGMDDDDDRFPLTTAFISQVEIPAGQGDALQTGHRSLGSEVKFDLMLYVRQAGDATALDLLHRAECFTPEAAQHFVDGLVTVMQGGIAEPDAPLRIELPGD